MTFPLLEMLELFEPLEPLEQLGLQIDICWGCAERCAWRPRHGRLLLPNCLCQRLYVVVAHFDH